MSQRGKRPNKPDNDHGGGTGTGGNSSATANINNNGGGSGGGGNNSSGGPPPNKRRKGRPPGSGSKNNLSSSVCDDDNNASSSYTERHQHQHHHHHNATSLKSGGTSGAVGNSGVSGTPTKAGGSSAASALNAADPSSKSWQPKSQNDLKGIYNRSAPEAPAELFRKDLISAMKLPDSEPLSANEYWLIVDQWKQEWERGVQVPVNPDALPQASVNTITECFIQRGRQDFKL